MTRSLALLAFTASLFAQHTVPVEKTQLADGVYLFSIGSDGYVPNGNSVAIINENDVLIFDTFSRPSTARTVLAELRKITGKPVRYIVNSHHHPDHWSGNEVFAQAFPGVKIIASEETNRFMHNIANAWPAVFQKNLHNDLAELAKESPEERSADEPVVGRERDFVDEALKLQRVFPTLTYRDHLTLFLGGREFRFTSMTGDAHGTTVMFLPKEKILVTGDVASGPNPYVSYTPGQQAHSLRTLASWNPSIVVPGHGPVVHGSDYLNLEAELLESIVEQVVALEEKGVVTVPEMQKAVSVESLRLKFTHDDKTLNTRFHTRVNSIIEYASREARDGRKFE